MSLGNQIIRLYEPPKIWCAVYRISLWTVCMHVVFTIQVEHGQI